jgi:hypothetical protein
MRPIKILLILLRSRLPWYMWAKGYLGLCVCIYDLHQKRRISVEEKCALKDYLYDHQLAHEYWRSYWWEPGRFWPRYRFLTKLIKEL